MELISCLILGAVEPGLGGVFDEVIFDAPYTLWVVRCVFQPAN